MAQYEMSLTMWRGLRDASLSNVVLNDIQAHFNRWAFLRLPF